jgi:hypothetical protein
MLCMKWGGRWEIVLCIAILYSAFLPVQANPVDNTFTMVFFEQDGKPVDDIVNFSINCYGTYVDGWPNKKKRDVNSTEPELVFHYSLHCQPYGCPLYNPFNTWMLVIHSCDLEGTYKEKSFIIRNFSRHPKEGSTCLIISDGNRYGNNHFYALSFENESDCYEQMIQNEGSCDQYLRTIQGEESKEDYVVRNKTKYSKSTEYLQCRSNVKAERQNCEKLHGGELNTTQIIQDPMGIPQSYCEQRFVLPSENKVSLESDRLTKNSIRQSPVASLYCSLLQFLGGRCE